jgi:hypothetical protein
MGSPGGVTMFVIVNPNQGSGFFCYHVVSIYKSFYKFDGLEDFVVFSIGPELGETPLREGFLAEPN